jgi:hypothetical protein
VLRDVFEFMQFVELKKIEKQLCNFEIRWQKSTKNCIKPFLNTRASFKKEFFQWSNISITCAYRFEKLKKLIIQL